MLVSECPCCGDPRPPVQYRNLSVSLDLGSAWAGRRFHLSPQHLSLLHHLTRRAPNPVRRDALFLSSMNPDVDDGMLTAQVCLLNKALRRQEIPLRVANDRAFGYRLEAAGTAR